MRNMLIYQIFQQQQQKKFLVSFVHFQDPFIIVMLHKYTFLSGIRIGFLLREVLFVAYSNLLNIGYFACFFKN